MIQPKIFSSSKAFEQSHNNRAYNRRKAIEEVDDDNERQRELEARKLADRKALRNSVQPTK